MSTERIPTLSDLTVTYRRVQLAMGAWIWGYPQGERHGITKYTQHRRKRDGKLIWKGLPGITSGITAGNEPFLRALFPEAFEHGVGSINNQLCY